MDIDVALRTAYIIVPIIVGIGAFFVRSQLTRIERLEDRMLLTISKVEFHDELDVRLESVKDSIEDIKNKLDKVYDFLINRQG